MTCESQEASHVFLPGRGSGFTPLENDRVGVEKPEVSGDPNGLVEYPG
jgi:hypothetical protein